MDDYVERANGLVVPALIGSDVASSKQCVVCGCTEWDACSDDFGSTCGWAQMDPPVCTFCAAGTDGESYHGGDESVDVDPMFEALDFDEEFEL